LSYQNIPQLCAALNDKGVGDGATVEEILRDRTGKTWAYLKSVAPDFEIFRPFIITNDIHNFKAALKGTMANREYRGLMTEPCTVEHNKVIDAVEHRKMSLLPGFMQKPCDEAYELLAHTGDARLADSVIDKAAMEEMLRLSREYKSEFLKKYFETLVFYSNVKTAIRAARTGAGRDFLNKALCEVAGFSKTAVIEEAVKGVEYLTGSLENKSDYGVDKAMEAYKKSPAAFEKYVDDRLILMAREACKRASEGAEPILGYYLGCEAENKVIHIISSGIRTRTNAEVIRERLREIYG
jgi:V/A-type H+-transporting ATPase subunit C